MMQETPSGWYPDPGQQSDGPPTERWWDGKAWTDQVRPSGPGGVWGPPEQLSADGMYPEHPGYPGRPLSSGRRGLHTGIAVGVAAVVLASIGFGVYALSSDDGSGGSSANSRQQGSGGQGGQDGPFGNSGGGQGNPFGDSGGGNGGSGGQSPSPEASEAPKVDSGSVTDSVSGISIPIPDGWYGRQISSGAHVTSDDTYKCPADTSQTCMKGGAYSAPAFALGTAGDTAEEVAKADIEENAEESYGEGYGEITSHDVLASKAVTVAGQKGYLVRWKAVTSKGTDGYVESLAFPSPADEEQIVVVRFGVDVGEGQTVLDEITKGIKVSTGGDGRDI